METSTIEYQSTDVVMLNTLTLEESIRKRPGMYFGDTGSRGIVYLICGIIKDCIEISSSNDILFTVSINPGDDICIKIESAHNLVPFICQVIRPDNTFALFANGLAFVTERLELAGNNFQAVFINRRIKHDNIIIPIPQTCVTMNFAMDKALFYNTDLDFEQLCDALCELALVNRGIEVLAMDFKLKYLNQRYYHFPQGVFYLFDKTKKGMRNQPSFDFIYDGQVGNNTYQVALFYHPDSYSDSSIISFANDENTSKGGSHVEGIIDGISLATKRYIKTSADLHCKVQKKKIFYGLTLICAVRGNDFKYLGSIKDELESVVVYAQLKATIAKLIYTYLNDNYEAAAQFIERFEVT